MFKKSVILLLLITIPSVFACSEDGKDGFVPENDLYIGVSEKVNSNLDETTFNKVIDNVLTVYQPIVRQLGGELKVIRKWNDGTVNAYAQRKGKSWMVSMFGGLARHATITKDGFALVVCHEIGHHIGGAPKKGGSGGGGWGGAGGLTWASNEGQSDYFATLKCLRKVFRNDNNATILASMNVPDVVSTTCANQFHNKADALICQRAAMAGQSTANLFAALRKLPKAPDFKTPSSKVVGKTDHNHPKAQCRIDTYYQGAICAMDDNTDVSQTDANIGVCSRKNGDKIGVRPLCWYKP